VNGPAPSDHAKSLVGERVTYTAGRRGRTDHTIDGEIVGVEHAGCSITLGDTGETYPAVRYLIESDTGRRIWTVPFPDTDRTVPRPLSPTAGHNRGTARRPEGAPPSTLGASRQRIQRDLEGRL